MNYLRFRKNQSMGMCSKLWGCLLLIGLLCNALPSHAKDWSNALSKDTIVSGCYYHFDYDEEIADSVAVCVGLADTELQDLVIPAEIDRKSGKRYKVELAERCFEEFVFASEEDLKYNITSVTISEGITTIPACCFMGCKKITAIDIPSSITKFGSYAFWYCVKLQSIKIPDKLEILEDGVFAGCQSLTEATIPEGITKLEDCVFAGCTKLKSVDISDKMTSIGMNCFMSCEALKVAFIRGNVTNIGDRAFMDCTSLEWLTIEGEEASIGEEAFAGCAKLWHLTELSIKKLGEAAFQGCTKLRYIPSFNMDSIKANTFEGCTSLGALNEYTFPNLITIGDRAFKDSNFILSGIWQNITSIGEEAFMNSTGSGLCELLNENIEIGNGAFKGHSGLEIRLRKQKPNFTDSTFPDNSTIYVPMGCGEAYREQLPNCNIIEEEDDTTTGVANATFGQAASKGIFTIDGRKLDASSTKNLPAGVYIVNGKKMVSK